MKFFLFITALFIFYNCCDQEYLQKNVIIGDWAYIEDTNNVYSYTELYITNDSLQFYGDAYIYGPFPYQYKDNIIKYSNNKLEIEIINDYKLIIKTDFCEVVLYRFVKNNSKENSKINPFYLRRVNFLVNMGYLNMWQAKDFFCKNDDEWKSEIQEEEITIQKRK